MRIIRAAACLLLLALVVGAEAGSKCANCGLGEGHDACSHGNTGIVAQKLAKPDFFASPEAIKNAIKRKSNKLAPSIKVSPTYSAPAASYNEPKSVYSTPTSSYAAPSSANSAPLAISSTYTAPATSLLSYFSSSNPSPPSTPLPSSRSKNYVQTTCKNNTARNADEVKLSKVNEDLENLLNLKPGSFVAPKFHPIEDLCNSCKGYKNGKGEENNVIGVVPAYPGKLPCKCPESELKPKPTTTPAPPTVYPTPAPEPAYGIPGRSYTDSTVYSAAAPSYSTPFPSYSAQVPSHSAQVPSYSNSVSTYSVSATSHRAPSPLSRAPVSLYSAPAITYSSIPTSFYNNPASSSSVASAVLAEYAPAYRPAAPTSYTPSSAPSTPVTIPAPTPVQYTPTLSAPAPPYSAPIPSYSIPTSSCSDSASLLRSASPSSQYAPAYQTAVPVSYASPSAPSATTAVHAVPTPALAQYSPGHSAPAPLYTVKTSLYNTLTPYSDLAPSIRSTSSYFEYAPAYQTAAPVSYASHSAPPRPATTPAPSLPPAQYAPEYQQQAPVIYLVEGVSPSPTKKICKKSKAQPDYEKEKRQVSAATLAATQAPVQYAPAYQQPAPASYSTASTSTSYVNAPASVTYAAAVESPAEKPCEQSNHQPDYSEDEQEAQTLVKIELQQEETPAYTADPVSLALAFKHFADLQNKKHITEHSLAYGHYKEPTDGRVSKRLSDIDEEKLHTLDQPVVELKCGKCGNSDCQNLQISYDDLGYGPIAPSKNRFVLKTDDESNSPCGPAIIYVPPPENKSSLPCGPLGPTIPGYKPGHVLRGDSNGKPTCGCCGQEASVEEGSRQVELIGCKCQKKEREEYESGRSKDGIIKRIKSSSCNCRQSGFK